MIRMAVTSRYARSLADVAFENSEEPAVTNDLFIFRDIFHAVPDLLQAFHNPAVPRDPKVKILAELLARYSVGRTTANFLRVLLDHNRLFYYQSILDQYIKAVNERKGIVTARVTAAVPLSDGALSTLRERLSQVTGKAVTLALNTDPNLVGGLVIQIGSTVYDGSIRTQLAEVKQRLMA